MRPFTPMAYGAEARKAVAEGRPTPKQKLLLRAIWELTRELGYAPNFREIIERMGLNSTNGLTEGLNKLQKEGWLTRENLVARSMALTKRGLDEIGVELDGVAWRYVASPPGEWQY